MNNEAGFDPTLHIVPLDKNGELPLVWLRDTEAKERLAESVLEISFENRGGFYAITDDGRISAFPIVFKPVSVGQHAGFINPLAQMIKDRMKLNYPRGKDAAGNKVKQYVFMCVMYQGKADAALIYDVVGAIDKSKEYEALYSCLASLSGETVGGEHWKEIEAYLANDPVKSWINGQLSFLKNQYNWSEYVRRQLELGKGEVK